MKKLILSLFVLLCMSAFAIAQDRTVSGTVTSQGDNLPIPGVSVKIVGASGGAITGSDGKYSVSVPSGATALQFSFIGYTTQNKPINSSGVINVALVGDSQGLNEVVVTALGIRREKKALGFSVTEVKGDELANVGNQNVLNSMNGKVAGVQVVSSGGAPGQAARIVIRGGNKSLTGNNEPLFVIDGVPISNANDGNSAANEVEGVGTPNRSADINPDDIETMTVLKGSAASVLYGNRGSNGVVLITTKSGKASKGKPVITFNSNFALDNAINLPEFQTEFAQGTNGVYQEGVSRSFGPRIAGQEVKSNAAGKNVTLQAFDPRKDFLRTGSLINTNLSIAQSTEKSDYYFSAGQSKQESIVPNQGFNKANVRLNMNNKISEKLSFGVNVGYTRSWGDVPSLGQSGSNPFFALFGMPVSWNLKGYGYEREDGSQINFRGGAFDNPLWTVNKTFNNTQTDRLTGAVNAAYKANDWLDFSYRLGNDYYNDISKSFFDINTGSNPNGALTNTNTYRQELTSTFLININKRISEDFNFSATLGQDYNQRKSRIYQQIGTALSLPSITTMNNVAAFSPDYEYTSLRRTIGAFADLKFDYKNFLFLNITGRNEWSSTLPINNRTYFYPGINTAFVFNEVLGINPDILSFGKIRAGFAKTTRDADPYQIYNTYAKSSFGDGFTDGVEFPFGATPGFTVSDLVRNANLKPESTKEFEFGTELRFLKNRIGLDVTYFENKNTDGIVAVDISPATGFTNAVLNSGVTRARGIEIGLNASPFRSADFSWDINVTFSRIRSKILETYPGIDKFYLGGFSGNPAIYAVKGERYGSIIGTGYARDEQGRVITDDDGLPTFVDGMNLGHTEADWTGGIRNSFKYKGIGFDFLVDTRQGGFMYNGTEESLDFYGVTKGTADREKDFVFPGVNENSGQPNGVVIKKDGDYYSFAQGNEEYVYKNNWVKLREANLNYTFNLNKEKSIKSLTVGVYGRNLFIWTHVPHVDPESSSFGTGNGQGATRFAFPTTRSFGLNLKAVF
ncbi:TonB-linked outer membrane protein, SusC/RagA family [Pedobacter antarcticus]|nr:SusC/RagA family TonB-linked outer membrane protein [Pedobacter antarcticus]SFE72407.1 TonB-linked outer membrane protein, SusC/RagA family [Pedobacter antarcticus]